MNKSSHMWMSPAMNATSHVWMDHVTYRWVVYKEPSTASGLCVSHDPSMCHMTHPILQMTLSVRVIFCAGSCLSTSVVDPVPRRSTSNQSSEPCEVAQYPQHRPIEYFKWRIPCVSWPNQYASSILVTHGSSIREVHIWVTYVVHVCVTRVWNMYVW